jgi:hypothetical protein
MAKTAIVFNSSADVLTIWWTASGSMIKVLFGPKGVVLPATVHSPEPPRTTMTSSQAWRWTGVAAPGGA